MQNGTIPRGLIAMRCTGSKCAISLLVLLKNICQHKGGNLDSFAVLMGDSRLLSPLENMRHPNYQHWLSGLYRKPELVKSLLKENSS